MGYYVMELQTGDTGACIPQWYPERPQAEQKYHMVLSAAAVSPIERHGAILCSDDLRYVKREIYDRVNSEPIDEEIEPMEGGEK